MNDRDAAIRGLYRMLRVCDLAGRLWNSVQWPDIPKPLQPGISILIPERANPALLSACLANVNAACREVAEPCEVIVVASGSPPSLYSDLVQRHTGVRWIFSEAPLWFGGAIQLGLRAARHDWVYLLNNDMLLDPGALAALLPWRAPHVFGIASQIYFQDSERRREETGWTICREIDGMVEILDEVADDDVTVRGTFYAGGGASLFRRELLARLAQNCSIYAPFYWEDVEWGACAWRLGYESLYCPTSKAWHGHRQTNRRFFSEPEIDRILRRNRLIFHLRNGRCPESLEQLRELLRQSDGDSLAEILRMRSIFKIAFGRLRNRSRWFRAIPLDSTWQRSYGSSLAVYAHDSDVFACRNQSPSGT
ncbi:MAG TPA: hypothetical protein DEQ47_09725 [Solibacterales bacterium]|nr:hypothetical protein [Bryobacterales bacterium]